MKFVLRVGTTLALSFLLVPAGFADGPAKAADKTKKVDANSSADASASAPRAAKSKAAPGQAAKKAPAAKKSGRAAKGSEAPAQLPMAAISGTLGLFTLETGQTLPTKGISFSAYANKFSRNPGSVSILSLGWNVGIGVRDWFTFYAGWEPYRHTHIGKANELSLRTPFDNPTQFPQFSGTMYRSLGPGLRPGYVEDFPFAANNSGGVGEMTFGAKIGLLSEQRGHPFSLSVRNDFIVPTRTRFTDLLNNGTQTGQFNYAVGVAVSRSWGNVVTLAGNIGYRFTRDPRNSAGTHSMTQADQLRVGAGFILFPESRIQFLSEYTGLIFEGSATPNTSFGARDPVDGVWGVRVYPWKNLAVDVGYRHMLNLRDVNDRSGFVVKVGTTYWAEKPIPVNHPPVASCSAEKSSVYTESGDVVSVNVTASDPDGDPLTFSWTATGGSVDGTGTQARWNSAGTAAGTYSVTAHVDDGRGGTASCSVDIRVEPRPNRPPVISCSVDRSSVLIGERVRVTATASDPDNDPLTFSWRTNGGQIIGSGPSVQLDTTGAAAGRYTVTGRVDDGRGGAADCSTTVDVQAPPPPPQASKINECLFRTTRVDNVCKRILDDVALRLKTEPRATVVIVGYADPKEPKPEKVAKLRADNAAKYVTSKGVDSSRLNTRAATGQKGAGKMNRRIDIVWVPEGASY